jgi:hypothetical protein
MKEGWQKTWHARRPTACWVRVLAVPGAVPATVVGIRRRAVKSSIWAGMGKGALGMRCPVLHAVG